MNFPRIMRAGIIILLIILLAILVRYFMIRPLGKPQVPLKTDDLTQQKIEKKDKIVHIEIKGGEESIRFKADKHYVGEDKNYHAEGNVEIIFISTNIMLICLDPDTFLSSFDFDMDNLIFLFYFLLS